LALLLAAGAPAQEESFAEAPPAEVKHTRKKPSAFHRPQEDSPAAQLAHAARLLVEGHDKKAAKQYLALVHQWHDSPEAVRAQLAYAEILLARDSLEKAFREFQYLIDHYAEKCSLDKVLAYQLEVADRMRTKKRGRILFYSGYRDPEAALPFLDRIIKNIQQKAPRWPRAPEVRFLQATIRETAREYSQAIKAYEILRCEYPQSPQAIEASYRRALCLWELSRRTPRDQQRCRVAISALNAFLNNYPKNKNADDAEKKIAALTQRLAGLTYEQAVFYDRAARRPRAALIAYKQYLKQFPRSSMAAEARERVMALEKEQEAGNAE
jgi:outer membrane protein assembly factor BamD (BamD/ComL family)